MSKLIEHYLTIDKDFGPVDFKEKGSRFISYAFPVNTDDEANQRISELRKEYYDCTHICSAFLIGKGSVQSFKYKDDGEPSGTAGLPIYNEITGAKLFNILIPVIRYYGGTKLGTGGLTRAYGRAAKTIIESLKPITVSIKKEFKIEFPYNFTGFIMQVCNKHGLDIIKQDYEQDSVKLSVAIPVGKIEEINDILINSSKGAFGLIE